MHTLSRLAPLSIFIALTVLSIALRPASAPVLPLALQTTDSTASPVPTGVETENAPTAVGSPGASPVPCIMPTALPAGSTTQPPLGASPAPSVGPAGGATTATPVLCLTPTPSLAANTAGMLAEAGKTVFANHCTSCHGANGQGVTAPANIGPDAHLEIYNTAQGLYDYVSTNMPQDAPGSLSQQEYLQVVSYLLVANGFVKPDIPLDPGKLGALPLQK